MLIQPFVLLITGPAGAGKTATASAWATARVQPTMQFSLDGARQFMKSGRAVPQDGWNDECQWQYELAREACAGLARLYVSRGLSCAIDDAIFPEWEAVTYEGWAKALEGLPHTMVVLMADLETLAQRNLERDSHVLRQDTVELLHRMMLPWRDQTRFPVIDTSSMTVDETVAAVDQVLRTLTPKP